MRVHVRILAKRTPKNAHVRVRLEFWQNAHVRAMCVRPKIECANVRACEAKNRRNSQLLIIHSVISNKEKTFPSPETLCL